MAFTDHCIDDPEVETLVFDSSKDIRDFAEQWTMGETGKKSLVSKMKDGSVSPMGFSMVYRKLDSLVHRTRKAGKNIVFTTRVKPSYMNGVKTSRVERDGYNKAPYQFDAVLHLQPGVKTDDNRTIYKKHIFGHVVKLGWTHYSMWPPYLVGCSYDGLINELYRGTWKENGSVDEYINTYIAPVMERAGVVE